MRVMVFGQRYNLGKLRFDGFRDPQGIPVDPPGYYWPNFFDGSGVYLGPDCEGIEPAFLGWGDFGFSPVERNRWECAGIDNPDTAAQFRTTGIGPDVVARWEDRGQVELAQVDSCHLGELISAISYAVN